MGFDIHGMNPKTDIPAPPKPELNSDIGWNDEIEKQWNVYSEWESISGVYFRNNVWDWRPLWHFVTAVCSDILTEKDIERGSFNDGHEISKTKSARIGKRLHKLIKNGEVMMYEEGYKEHVESLSDEDWNKSYPFSESNVKSFADFCINSGGFTIC